MVPSQRFQSFSEYRNEAFFRTCHLASPAFATVMHAISVLTRLHTIKKYQGRLLPASADYQALNYRKYGKRLPPGWLGEFHSLILQSCIHSSIVISLVGDAPRRSKGSHSSTAIGIPKYWPPLGAGWGQELASLVFWNILECPQNPGGDEHHAVLDHLLSVWYPFSLWKKKS